MFALQKLARPIRSKSARVVLASVLLGVSAWAFVPYFEYRIAPSAFINAELLRVTAPITGRLTENLPRKGEFINQPEKVTLIASMMTDRGHLLDLERQYVASKDSAEVARKQLDEIAVFDAELAKRNDAYRSGMISRLTHEVEEADAERTGCLAEAHQRIEVGSRMQALVDAGTSSQIRAAEAIATQAATSTRCRMAEARFQRLKGELSAAQDGVFLGNGANDVPYSQQQRDRLVLRRQELQTVRLQETLRIEQLTAEITEERNRLARVDHYDLTLPPSHVVWSVAASPGSAVVEGQTLVDFADCEHRFVVVDLPERDFEQIKAGDPAAVRLIGSNEWVEGKVRQVRGSAARADDRLLAAQVPTTGPGNITIEVSLVRGMTPADGNGFCDIGRMAEVRFQRSSFGLGQAISWLFHRKSASGTVLGLRGALDGSEPDASVGSSSTKAKTQLRPLTFGFGLTKRLALETVASK
jgi:multidrug resistance efflux pump